MANQPCFSDHSTTVYKPDYHRLNIDALLEPLFAVSGLIDASFDGLVESRSTESDQDDFIERAIHLGSVILEAGKRCARKRSTVHNTSVWRLRTDLTIKVFSILDTRSTCTAAATCSFFQKCSTDPLCYTSIDLATLPQKINVPKLNNDVASTMIERAGKALQSIKLVALHNYISYDEQDYGQRTESPMLAISCLSCLNANGGALGSHLRKLHLHQFEMRGDWFKMRDEEALSAALSVCPSLVELKFVGMFVPLCRVLESVSRYCRMLQHFIVEFNGVANHELKSSVLKEFVINCPKITTLTLQSCGLLDPHAFELLKGFHDLKYANFAHCWKLTGAFLKNLGTLGGANSLEVMILRDLDCLKKVEIENFMTALLAGKFKLLRHLDISESGGLVSNDDDDDDDDDDQYGYYRSQVRYAVSFFDIPIKKLLEHRPNFCLVVENNESD